MSRSFQDPILSSLMRRRSIRVHAKVSRDEAELIAQERKAYADRLSSALHKRGLNQVELARLAKITKGAVGHYLVGRRTPRPQITTRFAEILGVRREWLSCGHGKMFTAE